PALARSSLFPYTTLFRSGKAQDVVRRTCLEVEVGLDVDRGIFFHRLSQNIVDFYPLGLSVLFCKLLESSFHGGNAGVTLFVDAVAKAHDEVFIGQLFFRPSLGLGWVIDVEHIVHDRFIGTTVQWALERADGCDYCGVSI